jgi:methylated-DNA-[protein]-cysteine S-methyltransferase
VWVIIEPDTGVVRATTFRELDDAVRRLPDRVPVQVDDPDPRIAQVLADYALGDPTALDRVSVQQPGTPFRQQVWTSMRTIGFGDVDSYAELAERSGSPRAYRAVGTTCAENLVALFVPCHRVVASNGIGGYAYGRDVKRALLTHERAMDPRVR